MFTWIIPNRLGKSGALDVIPDNVFCIKVANELDPHFSIWDTDKYDIEQQTAIIGVVFTSLRIMAGGGSVILTCVEGRSRSPSLACLIASCWNQTSLEAEWQKLIAIDRTIRSDSEVLKTICRMDKDGMFNRYRRGYA